MTTRKETLRCAPGRTDGALAANSGRCQSCTAAGAAPGALIVDLGGVRGAFLGGGPLTAGVGMVPAGAQSFRGSGRTRPVR